MPPRRNATRTESEGSISLNRETLSKSLARVLPAVSRGGLVQAMTHYWFKPTEVSAYDGGLGIRLRYATGLDCGVTAHTLSKLLATSPLSEVELAYETETNQVRVKMGRSVSKLPALASDASVWPFPAEPAAAIKPLPITDALLEGLRQVLLIKSSQPTRVEHYGVTVVPGRNELTLFTTDSYALARVSVVSKQANALSGPVLLPRAFVEQLVGGGVNNASLYAQDDYLLALSDEVDFYNNVLDLSSADDLAALFTRITGNVPPAVEIPAGFTSALERAEILAGQADPYVTLAFEGEKLTVSARYPFGVLNEELELSGEHPTVQLQVKAPLVRRALAHSTELSASERVLFLSDGEGFSYVVAAPTTQR